MTTLQLLLVCIAVLILAALVNAGMTERLRAREARDLLANETPHVPLVTEGRVALHVDGGQSIIGNVVPGRDGFITLVAAELRTPGRSAQRMADPVQLRESSITMAQPAGKATELITDPVTGMSREVPVASNGTPA